MATGNFFFMDGHKFHFLLYRKALLGTGKMYFEYLQRIRKN